MDWFLKGYPHSPGQHWAPLLQVVFEGANRLGGVVRVTVEVRDDGDILVEAPLAIVVVSPYFDAIRARCLKDGGWREAAVAHPAVGVGPADVVPLGGEAERPLVGHRAPPADRAMIYRSNLVQGDYQGGQWGQCAVGEMHGGGYDKVKFRKRTDA